MIRLLVLCMFIILQEGSCKPIPDWLINKITTHVTSYQSDDNHLTLTNGLINRTFSLSHPGFGTVDYRSEVKSRSILRTILPEAYVTLDGIKYPIGGLYTNITHSYLNRSYPNINVLPRSFLYSSYSVRNPIAPFHWEPGYRHAPADGDWPPKGLTLDVIFVPPPDVAKPSHGDVIIHIKYEMYEGAPLMSKWMTVENFGKTPIRVDGVTVENLGTQKPYAPFNLQAFPNPWVNDDQLVTTSWLFIESDTPHDVSLSWGTDQNSATSPGADEPTFIASYITGPGVILGPTDEDTLQQRFKTSGKKKFPRSLISFDTFGVIELVTDSDDRERVAMSRHRMIRLLAPQTQENPIFFHGTNTSDAGFKATVDQMEEVGFEMFIYSFGSGFNLEDIREEHIKSVAANVAYANSKGIEVGGYDLIDLARGHSYGGNVGDRWINVDQNGHLTGNVCFASGWYDLISMVMLKYVNETGLSMFETDGPYFGDKCFSKNHLYHLDEEDSVYWQTRFQIELYKELKKKNVFINQPDEYFYSGGNKVGMGYSEQQYNLPRWEDLSVSRATMFDDTFNRLPTQGWMFLPLVVYHSGGAAAMFEPLSEHYTEYEWGLAQYFGYGVAACYRGNRLYDSPKTQSLVKKWVDFYKTYRDILISDIVHVRRPDMQDYDCILHVNHLIKNRGLAMIFNPTDSHIEREVTLPLYYTGINQRALVMQEGVLPGTSYTIERDYSLTISFSMKPKTITWFLIHSMDN